jgi:hypothetical protein
LLIAAIGLSGFAHVLIPRITQFSFIQRSGLIFLAYGASVSVSNGILHGHSLGIVMRDMIAFGFLMLPLFFMKQLADSPIAFRRNLMIGCTVIGALFSARSILNSLQVDASLLGMPITGDLLYLANMPTVLFTTLFLIGWSIHRLCQSRRLVSFWALIPIILAIAVITIGTLSMVLTMQRASLGCIALYTVIMIGMNLRKSPLRSTIIIVSFGIMLAAIWPMLHAVLDMVVQKTTLTGFNKRFEEMAAVWDTASSSPLTLLFGKGWGATFASPAVAGVTVSFTHSMLTTLLLKTGVIGVVLGGVYIWAIMKTLIGHMRQHTIIALALLFPFLIDIFLYASFKSLDFGLILTLVLASTAISSNHNNSVKHG